MRAGRCAADALARGGRGEVVCVHRRAVNLLFGDGALVALLPADSPLHPWAVAGPFDPSRLRVGMEVMASVDRLVIGEIPISLEDLEVVELTLRRRPKAFTPDAVSDVKCGGSAAALSGARHDGAGRACALHTTCHETLARFREEGDVSALAHLIGVGEGLTPSGDDMIVGAFAALDLARVADPEAARRRCELIEALPPDLEAHTTRLSAQMIRAAIEGRFAEPLVRLADALARPDLDESEVERAFREVAAMGHQSGRDTLAGFTAALDLTNQDIMRAAGVARPSLDTEHRE